MDNRNKRNLQVEEVMRRILPEGLLEVVEHASPLLVNAVEQPRRVAKKHAPLPKEEDIPVFSKMATHLAVQPHLEVKEVEHKR